ncbi:MAG TPA: cobalt-precorrin-7 (C(5))-methyltransferase [Methanospirillum sp.]|nr:cobalt-precorrin-7 (C(5))-methyltransferase [Methanospirillum sp.]
MRIIGIGCGPGLITVQAIEVIRQSTMILGSNRAIELVREYIPAKCEVQEILDYRALKTLPDHAVVLSTGDPMLSGLGYLPGEVVPGISSLQLGAARLHLPLIGLLAISAHGREHQEPMRRAVEEISKGRAVCIITDPGFSLPDLANEFPKDSRARIVICQNLGYPDECIIEGTVQIPPEPSSGMYIIFIIPT